MADGATSGCGRWTDWVSASTPRRRPPVGPRAKLLSVAWLATARSSDLTSPQHWPIGLSWKRFPRLLADARTPAKGPPGTPVRPARPSLTEELPGRAQLNPTIS